MPLSPLKSPAKFKPRRAPAFDLIGGNVCLDFVNTLDDRHMQPKELLVSYNDLVRFAEDTGVLDTTHAARLSRESSARPRPAQEALSRALDLREAIHDVFWAIMNHRPAPPEALNRLNAAVQSEASHLHLVPSKHGFEWSYDDGDSFDSAWWPIAHAAADLLASDQLQYVRACFSKTCEWFFLDTSKNHQRRWCDMTRCGNRAKAQAFYERQKQSD